MSRSRETFPSPNEAAMSPQQLALLASEALTLDTVTADNFACLKNMLANSDVECLMIGESTHGTDEFYHVRAQISQSLIECGWADFVAVEGDWPDCYRVNRYIHGMPPPLSAMQQPDQSATEALSDFTRFPRWMWRNDRVRDFVDFCRQYNDKQRSMNASIIESGMEHKEQFDKPCPNRLVSFYGVDLYSLYTSLDAVVAWLDRTDKSLATKARERYATLDSFRDEAAEYGYAVKLGLVESQEKEVTQMLIDLYKSGKASQDSKGFCLDDEKFYTEMNARLVKDAEEYYRNSYSGGHTTWNIRDRHMADVTEALLKHHTSYLASQGIHRPARGILWAHNSHLGDARATQMKLVREVNLGQLMRERLGLNRTFNIGWTTYDGTVTAATAWGGRAQTMDVNPGITGSYEGEMHRVRQAVSGNNPRTDTSMFGYLFRSPSKSIAPVSNSARLLGDARLERAIGVQYCKRTERQSHYICCQLPAQFDLYLHYDRTHALQPLDTE